MIEESGPIYRRQKDERARLNAEIDNLTNELASLKNDIQKDQNQQDSSQGVRTSNKYRAWSYVALAGCILLLILFGITRRNLIVTKYLVQSQIENIDSLRNVLDTTRRMLEDTVETFDEFLRLADDCSLPDIIKCEYHSYYDYELKIHNNSTDTLTMQIKREDGSIFKSAKVPSKSGLWTGLDKYTDSDSFFSLSIFYKEHLLHSTRLNKSGFYWRFEKPMSLQNMYENYQERKESE